MFNLKKKIDIIMPNYNKGNYIGTAIKSVINQSYKNWNLYIIDDNSQDNSKDQILIYKKDKRIKTIFLKKNKGPSFCRNYGLKKAKSSFIAFLDSDDYWKKNKLKHQLNFMLKKKYPFTFTDYIPILENKNKNYFLKKTNIISSFTFNKFIGNSSINTSTMILERKFIKNLKFRNLSLMEDYIFKCDLMKKTNIPFKKFSEASSIYRIIRKSRSSKKIKNIYYLWKLNKKYNKLGTLLNLKSILNISINSLKKYGFK
jgi:teichuronic acid biosynthesis glycosyltransferase TuaG